MFALIFDCESNGFYRSPTKSGEPDKRSARVIQLAWELVDLDDGELVRKEKFLIKPDGWIIPMKPFWINNGYSTKRSLREGAPIQDVLRLFNLSYAAADVLVAHNLIFDNRAVGDEMLRYRILPEKKPGMLKICTMKSATEYCSMQFANGRKGNKPPKLEELYEMLFGKKMDGAHDSGADVTACRECFFELINRKIITL